MASPKLTRDNINNGTPPKRARKQSLHERLDSLEANLSALKSDYHHICELLAKNNSAFEDFNTKILSHLSQMKELCMPTQSINVISSSNQQGKATTPLSVKDNKGTPCLSAKVCKTNVISAGQNLPRSKGKQALMQNTHALLGRKLFKEQLEETCDASSLTPKSNNLSPSFYSRGTQISDDEEDKSLIPTSMEVRFYPTPSMDLSQLEIEVAAYIFSDSEPLSGLLIKCSAGYLSRLEIFSLCPKHWVNGHVLEMVAARMTYEERKKKSISVWYFPPHFSKSKLDGSLSVEKVTRGYYDLYMSNDIDNLQKIYIPLNDSNIHWYLLIICIEEKQLLYLDSDPSEESEKNRHEQIIEMASFMENVLGHKKFHNTCWNVVPEISKWPIVSPPGVPRQQNYFDCGVCVGGWMTLNTIWGDFRTVPRGYIGRMRLALDIVLADYNLVKDDIIVVAKGHWDDHDNSITI